MMLQVRHASPSFIVHASLYSTTMHVLGMDWELDEAKVGNVWSLRGPLWTFRGRETCMVDRYEG